MDRNNKKSALVYAIILALTLVFFAFTVNRETLAALAGLNPLNFPPLVALWMAGILLDALALVLFLRAGGQRLSVPAALKNTFIRLFFNVVTPSSFGGQPFAIAALKGEGIAYGAGSTAVFAKTAAYTAANFACAFAAMLLFRPRLAAIPAFGPVFVATGVLGFAGIAFFLTALFVPAMLIPAARAAGRLASAAARALRKDLDARSFAVKLLAECALARRTLRSYFMRRRACALSGCALTALIHLANLSLLWCALNFLGLGIGYADGLILGSLLFFLISFMPTPGGSGLGEAIFAALLAGRVPVHLLCPAILVWRTFNQYLNTAIGSVLSAGQFSRPPAASREERRAA